MDGLAPVYRTIATGQQRLLVTGRLRIDVQVSPDGMAEAVKVIESPSAESTKFVASVLLMERYKPALCGGAPCRMDVPFVVEFTTR